MKYFLDANIFLRYFTDEGNDNVLKECTSLFEIIQQKSINTKTSQLVLSEVVWTLKSYYKAKKLDIIKVLTKIQAFGINVDNNTDNNLTLKLFKKHNVKYIDAVIASSVNVHSGTTVVLSYDRDFDKLGVKRMEPADVLRQIAA